MRFRQAQHRLLGEVIRLQLTKPQLSAYLQRYMAEHIPKDSHAAFWRNVEEDLRLLSPSRMVGLGVSHEQLQQWQTLQVVNQDKPPPSLDTNH